MQWEPNKQLDELASRVIGAAIEVHRTLGPGYNESIYELSLCHELELLHIRHTHEEIFRIIFKGREVGQHRLDILVEGILVVELKSVESLANLHRAQVLSYLKLTNLNLGLLINFNVPVLKDGIRRVIRPPEN